ncbi:MAG: helix-turn-helix domain-containing protein [Chitinophagales bacterium]|jgi:transcriptional regulator with XRE-family HTH domain/predicted transcriptional regulator|nr:helix-turn-helix domain-containing protein [Chitinophagales bacterium]
MINNVSEERIRLIFGLKLRHARIDKKLSLSELADRAGLSVSYLNEIEKGKKYPKTDKITLLANALDTDYDSMVSLKLPKPLAPIATLLTSNFLDEIPLAVFGINTAKLVDIMSAAPAKVNAFIAAIIDISRNYNLTQKQFLSAVSQSYQELHENYFEELETAADQCRAVLGWSQANLTNEQLTTALLDQYKVLIDENSLSQYPELTTFRSLFIKGKPHRLLIDRNLSAEQKKFILAKEIGYHFLGLDLQQRTYIYQSWVNTNTFDQALINFKASYFAGAIQMPQAIFADDLRQWLSQTTWQPDEVLRLLKRYGVTLETFMYRLTNLLPKFLGLNQLFFIRFNHESGSDVYDLNKEIHLSQRHNPHANKWGEHYCRRWLSINIFQQLDTQAEGVVVAAQRSRYHDSKNEYLIISMARRVLANPNRNVSMTIGILLNGDTKRKIKFWDCEAIRVRKVNVTCERCSIADCESRAAEPTIYQENQQIDRITHLINELSAASK